MSRLRDIFRTMGSISARLSSLRKLYEAENIPNKVVDGTTPFPENAQSIGDGISLEFRYFVCFLQILYASVHLAFAEMSRSNILEVSNMLYAASLSESCRANFAYVLPCYVSSGCHETGLILYPRRVLGHSWLEWIRKKYDSKAYCSNTRPHGGEHTHRWIRY